jgi:sRNA-binding carbon storage regulator CsrA
MALILTRRSGEGLVFRKDGKTFAKIKVHGGKQGGRIQVEVIADLDIEVLRDEIVERRINTLWGEMPVGNAKSGEASP